LIHRVESLGLPVTTVVARRVKGRIDDPEMRGAGLIGPI
jgi:hypothetical protein